MNGAVVQGMAVLVALAAMVVAMVAAFRTRAHRRAIDQSLEAMIRADAQLAARMRWIRAESTRLGLPPGPQYRPELAVVTELKSINVPVVVGGAEPDWRFRGMALAFVGAVLSAMIFASLYFNLRGQAQQACVTAAGPLDLSSWVQLCKGVG